MSVFLGAARFNSLTFSLAILDLIALVAAAQLVAIKVMASLKDTQAVRLF